MASDIRLNDTQVLVDGELMIGGGINCNAITSSGDLTTPGTVHSNAVIAAGDLTAQGTVHGKAVATGQINVPASNGYPSILKVQFDGAQGYAGRIALAPSFAGRALLHCDVEAFELHNPKVTDPLGRVALTHTAADQLVLNDGGHYAGGVSIEGSTRMDGLTVQGTATFANVASFSKGIKIGNISIGVISDVVIGVPHSTTTYALDITAETIVATATQIGLPGHQVKETLDLVAEIRSLRHRVAELEQKVGLPVPS